MCLLLLLEVLDVRLELALRLARRSFFAFSCAISSRIRLPWSTIMCMGLAGEREECESGVAGGVQSVSSAEKTEGKSSSSEMNEEDEEAAVVPEREERRGQEGKAQDGDCGRELEDEEGISIGEVCE